jgi:hypothetical protein
MDSQILELINHELEMQNKLPMAPVNTSSEESESENEDLYLKTVKRGVGGGLTTEIKRI